MDLNLSTKDTPMYFDPREQPVLPSVDYHRGKQRSERVAFLNIIDPSSTDFETWLWAFFHDDQNIISSLPKHLIPLALELVSKWEVNKARAKKASA